jgi:hypothetical protein
MPGTTSVIIKETVANPAPSATRQIRVVCKGNFFDFETNTASAEQSALVVRPRLAKSSSRLTSGSTYEMIHPA